MELTEEQARKIEAFSTEFYKKLDFAHNIDHMKQTVKLADFIATEEGANLEIVRLGAMVHQFHDNIPELETFLETLDLEPAVKKKLVECAEFRPFKEPKAASIEAKVVYDADALQVLGPRGVLREIACNLNVKGKSFEDSISNAKDIERRFYDSLQTETAKKMITDQHELMKKFWAEYDRP